MASPDPHRCGRLWQDAPGVGGGGQGRCTPNAESDLQINKKTFQLSFLVLALVVMLTSLLTSAAAARGNPKTLGHANLTVGDGQKRTFSFTAVQHKDGTVTGQGEVNNPSFPIRIHFEID